MSSADYNLSLFETEQFRMRALQVYHWGTFHGLHHIPISEKGFLFVGRSGAGKSTLLDAISALLVPPRWLDFNAAAREMARSGHDRNVLSYVRGAWSEQKDNDSGEIATRYLRTGTTWSALALRYENPSGRVVVLVQIFWLRGNSNSNTDVRRVYLISEGDFDLRALQSFAESNFDLRKLKQTFSQAFIREEFSAYAERFRHLLGIESEMALRLLHKTQSAKNLGDLNVFLRDFMLDKPQTFAVAQRLVNEFAELNAAYRAVVDAREQIAVLRPAAQAHQEYVHLQSLRSYHEQLKQGIDIYSNHCRRQLLGEAIERLMKRQHHQQHVQQQAEQEKNHQEVLLENLRLQHLAAGGSELRHLEQACRDWEDKRDKRVQQSAELQKICLALDWHFPNTVEEFAQLSVSAQQEKEDWNARYDSENERYIALKQALNQALQERDSLQADILEMLRQPSNIPRTLLTLRREMAEALNVHESQFPFVGELLEVKAQEAAWRGAIERLLRGFALSLLVDEAQYAGVNKYVNERQLGQRLVFYRLSGVDKSPSSLRSTDSVLHKLQIKEHPHRYWLEQQLRQRFDYVCVENLAALRQAERALTQEGQIKHNQMRHEKDDRHALNERRQWVLGFDNREKLALYQQQLHQLEAEIEALEQTIDGLQKKKKQQEERMGYCHRLMLLNWQDVDVSSAVKHIDALNRQIDRLRQDAQHLQTLEAEIEQQHSRYQKVKELWEQARLAYLQIEQDLAKYQKQLEHLQTQALATLLPREKEALAERFQSIAEELTQENLSEVTLAVERQLSEDIKGQTKQIHSHERFIEECFAEFKRRWQAEAGDVDASLASAGDYFNKLNRLESDGLPEYEQRFFDLLQSQSQQNLAALSSYLMQARKDILHRMELVNESLGQVPFNQQGGEKSFLKIEVKDRYLPEVKEFRKDIQQALSHAFVQESREEAEARFLILQKIVQRLSGTEAEAKRWRELMLDVRLHVEFIGLEYDEAGKVLETHRSGAAKSGGQRQKLAATCLAAALRYQLGGHDHGLPMYAPVVLDEAFDKADNEFTALAMNIFINFGFQMIVATPLKSVMTLEPFIGGACFVDISERKYSSVLLIDYDESHQRLNVPADAAQ